MNFRILIILIVVLINSCSTQQGIENIEEGILTIDHMEFGREKFLVQEAKYNLYKTEDNIWEFVVSVEADSAIVRSKELQEVVDAEPSLEATAILPADQIELKKGQVITQKESYDDNRGEHLSNMYYFSHESIEKLRVEILEYHDDHIMAQMTGEVIINGSNGANPDSKISVRVKFLKDNALQRGVE